MKKYIVLFILGISLVSCKTSKDTLANLTFKEKLQVLFPTSEISPIDVTDHFKESYQVILNQPLDHNNPEAGTFKHYMYVSHFKNDAPTVLITEGYNARPRTYELSTLLDANQVMVEYRFYGKSRPNPIPWKYLKNDQAIEDYHSIITKLKLLYSGKFISTGISKGGETVLIYKSKYPDDVDVAVPYVAPLINTQEDPKTTRHLYTVGDADCRLKVTNFQRLLLVHREVLIKEINEYANDKKMSFTEVSVEEALEYGALEFSFSFWQWGGKCEEIPSNDASPKELFDYLNKIVGISFYNDQTFYDLLPSYYQHMVELGYYGFDFEPVKDLLKVVKSTSNDRFAPYNIDITYNSQYIKKVRDYVENKGDKIAYIYGEYDTWGACRPHPKDHVDALMMVLPKGAHGTRIKHFPEEDQKKILAKINTWLAD